jgi:hypothetical protein
LPGQPNPAHLAFDADLGPSFEHFAHGLKQRVESGR